LDLSVINLSVEVTTGEGKRGRPPRSQQAMIKAFIVLVFRGDSERGLERFLRNYPYWSRLCGFKGNPPCHATFSNFKKRIGEVTLKKILKDLVEQLIETGALPLEKVAVDSTDLTAIWNDGEARWGFTREGPFFGYKVHIVCCTDTELPVHISVTTGNVHDSTQWLTLMKGARSYKTGIAYVIADSAYDTIEIHEKSMEEYNIIPVIPYNPRNGKKIYNYGIERLYYYDVKPLKKIYKCRTAVERVNNIIKEQLGLNSIRYKGLRAVTFQVYITCIAQLAAAFTAVLCSRPKDMRKVSLFK
jgi:IS5 family transposase